MAQVERDPDQGNESAHSVLQRYTPFLTLGIQLAATVVILFFIGRWLDQRLNTSPWLMMATTFIGIAGGLYKFIATAVALSKKEQERWDAGKRG